MTCPAADGLRRHHQQIKTMKQTKNNEPVNEELLTRILVGMVVVVIIVIAAFFAGIVIGQRMVGHF